MVKQLNRLLLKEADDIAVDLQEHVDLTLSSRKVLLSRLAEIHGMEDLAANVRSYSEDEEALIALEYENVALTAALERLKGK